MRFVPVLSRLLPLLLFITLSAAGQPLHPNVPLAAAASAHFDPKAATDAWLATISTQAKDRSDAYFEGGYWLILWEPVWTSGIMLLLLRTRWSAKMRGRSGRLQTALYWCKFYISVWVLSLPLDVYSGYWREKQYGLMNQSFGGWFHDYLIELALALVLGAPAFAILMAFVRRFRSSWHWWGMGISIVFSAIGIAIAPVFIAPLFNRYQPLQNQLIKQQILSMAHQNGIPVSNVYEVNASKQSDRVSAFVTGVAGSERIVLNDNLLKRVSPEGIMAVMGHEMGHYVLGHIPVTLMFLTIVYLLMFAILRYGMDWGISRFGARWGISDPLDIAALPFAVLILAILGFLFTPFGNTFTRTQEYQADIFGLNTSRQPDGEAEVDLLLGEYRKLDPNPIEEFLFFDHPSGRSRIYAAMRWKAENLCLFNASLPCPNRPKALGTP